jgi:hypothetical protein
MFFTRGPRSVRHRSYFILHDIMLPASVARQFSASRSFMHRSDCPTHKPNAQPGFKNVAGFSEIRQGISEKLALFIKKLILFTKKQYCSLKIGAKSDSAPSIFSTPSKFLTLHTARFFVLGFRFSVLALGFLQTRWPSFLPSRRPSFLCFRFLPPSRTLLQSQFSLLTCRNDFFSNLSFLAAPWLVHAVVRSGLRVHIFLWRFWFPQHRLSIDSCV